MATEVLAHRLLAGSTTKMHYCQIEISSMTRVSSSRDLLGIDLRLGTLKDRSPEETPWNSAYHRFSTVTALGSKNVTVFHPRSPSSRTFLPHNLLHNKAPTYTFPFTMFSYWKAAKPTANEACNGKDTEPCTQVEDNESSSEKNTESKSKPGSTGTELSDAHHGLTDPHEYLSSRVLYTYNQLLLNEFENRLLTTDVSEALRPRIQAGIYILPHVMKLKTKLTKWADEHGVLRLDVKLDERSGIINYHAKKVKCKYHVPFFVPPARAAVKHGKNEQAPVYPSVQRECQCEEDSVVLREELLFGMLILSQNVSKYFLSNVFEDAAYLSRDIKQLGRTLFTDVLKTKPINEDAKAVRYTYAVESDNMDLLDVNNIPIDFEEIKADIEEEMKWAHEDFKDVPVTESRWGHNMVDAFCLIDDHIASVLEEDCDEF
ncbi:hypothetical protein BJ508DRAFT_350215 [Ascobolus immersus RN42]|uniref:Uncharacterized protein n=1 Tax=Ascobolus immersus RN42 TaxID=1160509 RepID=A0A3N4HVC2_ASCIM|nr:hypothetical protein BJ508DRAFT_350215 [Ascobolus immersus RN42]